MAEDNTQIPQSIEPTFELRRHRIDQEYGNSLASMLRYKQAVADFAAKVGRENIQAINDTWAGRWTTVIWYWEERR